MEQGQLVCLYRQSSLIVEGGKILQQILNHYLKEKSISFEEFLENNKHELFHWRWLHRCCLSCSQGFSKSMDEYHWTKLYENSEGSSCENRHLLSIAQQDQCPNCWKPRGLTPAACDAILLHKLIVKASCVVEFFIKTDQQLKNISNLGEYLNDDHNLHIMYHLLKSKQQCCRCFTGFAQSYIGEQLKEWDHLYLWNREKKQCGQQNCICGYEVKKTNIDLSSLLPWEVCLIGISLSDVLRSVQAAEKVIYLPQAHSRKIPMLDQDVRQNWEEIFTTFSSIAVEFDKIGSSNCASLFSLMTDRLKSYLPSPDELHKLESSTQPLGDVTSTDQGDDVNFFRQSKLILDIGGNGMRQVLKSFLETENLNFKTFLEDEKHSLFHLRRLRSCCSCRAPFANKLDDYQWNVLFEGMYTTSSMCAKDHSAGVPQHEQCINTWCVRQYDDHVVTVDDCDITLLFRIISLSKPVVGYFIQEDMKSLSIQSFPDYLSNLTTLHSLFHSFKSKEKCCKCSNLSQPPIEVDKGRLWENLFCRQHGKPKCYHPNCICNFVVRKSNLKMSDIYPHDLWSVGSTLVPILRCIKEFKEKRNLLHGHVFGTEMNRKQFTENWKSVSSILVALAEEIDGVFASFMTSKIKRDIETLRCSCPTSNEMKELTDRVSKFIQNELKVSENLDCLLQVVNQPKDTNREYLEELIQQHEREPIITTRAVRKGVQYLMEKNSAVFVGQPGIGMTWHSIEVIRHVLLDNEVSNLVFLDTFTFNRKIWNECVNTRDNLTILMLDNVSHGILEDQKSLMKNILKMSEKGNLKVVINMRTEDYHFLSTKHIDPIDKINVIDLTAEEFKLNQEEKLDMIKRYLWYANGSGSLGLNVTIGEKDSLDVGVISEITLGKISKTEPLSPCYPEVCRIFSFSLEMFKKGLFCFREPQKTLLDQLTNLCKMSSPQFDRSSFCLLSFVLFKDECRGLNSESDQDLCTDICNLLHAKESDFAFCLHVELKQYLKMEENGRFSFQHDTMKLAVAYVFTRFETPCFNFFVECGPLDILLELLTVYRPQGEALVGWRPFIGLTERDGFFETSSEQFQLIMSRFGREILKYGPKSSQTALILNHGIMTYLLQDVVSYFGNNDKEVLSIMFMTNPEGNFQRQLSTLLGNNEPVKHEIAASTYAQRLHEIISGPGLQKGTKQVFLHFLQLYLNDSDIDITEYTRRDFICFIELVSRLSFSARMSVAKGSVYIPDSVSKFICDPSDIIRKIIQLAIENKFLQKDDVKQLLAKLLEGHQFHAAHVLLEGQRDFTWWDEAITPHFESNNDDVRNWIEKYVIGTHADPELHNETKAQRLLYALQTDFLLFDSLYNAAEIEIRTGFLRKFLKNPSFLLQYCKVKKLPYLGRNSKYAIHTVDYDDFMKDLIVRCPDDARKTLFMQICESKETTSTVVYYGLLPTDEDCAECSQLGNLADIDQTLCRKSMIFIGDVTKSSHDLKAVNMCYFHFHVFLRSFSTKSDFDGCNVETLLSLNKRPFYMELKETCNHAPDKTFICACENGNLPLLESLRDFDFEFNLKTVGCGLSHAVQEGYFDIVEYVLSRLFAKAHDMTNLLVEIIDTAIGKPNHETLFVILTCNLVVDNFISSPRSVSRMMTLSVQKGYFHLQKKYISRCLSLPKDKRLKIQGFLFLRCDFVDVVRSLTVDEQQILQNMICSLQLHELLGILYRNIDDDLRDILICVLEQRDDLRIGDLMHIVHASYVQNHWEITRAVLSVFADDDLSKYCRCRRCDSTQTYDVCVVTILRNVSKRNSFLNKLKGMVTRKVRF